MAAQDNSCFKPSYPFSNRLRRALWNIVFLLLFFPSPRPFFAWRMFLLRLFGAKAGKSCRIQRSASIWAPWNLSLGDFVGIGDYVKLYNQAPITIADNVIISMGAHLCTGSHDYASKDFRLVAKPIRVEKDSWIAAEAFVMPGVTIKEGSVVGARSVVTKDTMPWTVSAGNPCRPIKSRKEIKNTKF